MLEGDTRVLLRCRRERSLLLPPVLIDSADGTAANCTLDMATAELFSVIVETCFLRRRLCCEPDALCTDSEQPLLLGAVRRRRWPDDVGVRSRMTEPS